MPEFSFRFDVQDRTNNFTCARTLMSCTPPLIARIRTSVECTRTLRQGKRMLTGSDASTDGRHWTSAIDV